MSSALNTTTVRTANKIAPSYFAQVNDDNEILSICEVTGDGDHNAAARTWFAACDYVDGATLVSLDLALGQEAEVGDKVEVDEDGCATLAE